MESRQACAANLEGRRILLRIGRRELAERAAVDYKKLCRWLSRGLVRSQTNKQQLKPVCEVLGISVDTLWQPHDDGLPNRWTEILVALLELTDKHHAWYLINDLLSELQRRYCIAVAADTLADHNPDLMPENYRPKDSLPPLRKPYYVFFDLMHQWNGLSTAQEYYDRLVGHLMAQPIADEATKKAVEAQVRREVSAEVSRLKGELRAAQIELAEQVRRLKQSHDDLAFALGKRESSPLPSDPSGLISWLRENRIDLWKRWVTALESEETAEESLEAVLENNGTPEGAIQFIEKTLGERERESP